MKSDFNLHLAVLLLILHGPDKPPSSKDSQVLSTLPVLLACRLTLWAPHFRFPRMARHQLARDLLL